MNNLANTRTIQAAVLGLTGVILGSSKSVFAKMAYEYNADPISVLYLRMLISLPFLLAIGFLYEKKQRNYRLVEWKDVVTIIALSILGYYISSVFDFVGLLYVEAGIERLIIFMYPTIVIALAAIFLKKKIKYRQMMAIVVSYLGIILAFADKILLKNTPQFWLGVLFIFLSSLTYAIFLVASEKLISRLGSVRFTTIATLTMSFCIIFHAMFTGKTDIGNLDPHILWSCTLMALLSTIAPIYMFNFAMGKLGVTNISIISCLGPICTLILSSLLINEKITSWEIAGTFIVMGSILIISFDKFSIESLNIYLRKSYAMIAVWNRIKK